MRFTVHAKPKSRKDFVLQDPENAQILTVSTTQPADKGRANDAIVKLIADHFGVARSSVILVSGAKARIKIVDVQER